MGSPLEDWHQAHIEELPTGGSWYGQNYSVHRYRDGWYFMWSYIAPGHGMCFDLGRFFDENHIWEMRNFMAGKWDRGVLIPCPSIDIPEYE